MFAWSFGGLITKKAHLKNAVQSGSEMRLAVSMRDFQQKYQGGQ